MTNEERIEKSKKKIFDAALQEFAQNGYTGASVNAICKQGIPKGLLYHIYKDKKEIYLACVEQCYGELLETLERKLDSKVCDLEKYMSVRKRFFRKYPLKAKIIYETMATVHPDVDEGIREKRAAFDAYNREYFRQIVRGLRLRDDVSEEDAVEYFSLVQTVFHEHFRRQIQTDECGHDSVNEKDNMSAEEVQEEMVPRIIDFILHGIVVDKKV